MHRGVTEDVLVRELRPSQTKPPDIIAEQLRDWELLFVRQRHLEFSTNSSQTRCVDNVSGRLIESRY
jgi:hypothetical protein